MRCPDLAPYCGRIGLIGIRARQICPQTCGCHLPRSPLALFLPESGCPTRCTLNVPYRQALLATPCVDVARNDTNFVAFLDNWYDVSEGMPLDWRTSGRAYVDQFRRFGCDYLRFRTVPLWDNIVALNIDWRAVGLVNDSTSPGWDGVHPGMPASQPLYFTASFSAQLNPCVENGFYYPIKPLSYFCPVACGCRAGDNACPDTCPTRFDGGVNGLGQVAYSGFEPSASPDLADPLIPWMYGSNTGNSTAQSYSDF